MNKESLLRVIAEDAYNVGFGAKRNFATYDIVTKIPGWCSFIILAIGILQLGYEELLGSKEVSFGLIIVSIITLYINCYNSDIEKYNKEGKRLTNLYNKLKRLYYNVADHDNNNYDNEAAELESIKSEYNSETISKQIFCSNWLAHFKFFYEMEVGWINKELNLRFWKDKIPNSFKLLILILLLCFISIILYCLINYMY